MLRDLNDITLSNAYDDGMCSEKIVFKKKSTHTHVQSEKRDVRTRACGVKRTRTENERRVSTLENDG